MKLRFDEVLYDLERERLRVEDLRRLADVAAHLRSLLLTRRRSLRRQRRCTARRSL